LSRTQSTEPGCTVCIDSIEPNRTQAEAEITHRRYPRDPRPQFPQIHSLPPHSFLDPEFTEQQGRRVDEFLVPPPRPPVPPPSGPPLGLPPPPGPLLPSPPTAPPPLFRSSPPPMLQVPARLPPPRTVQPRRGSHCRSRLGRHPRPASDMFLLSSVVCLLCCSLIAAAERPPGRPPHQRPGACDGC
jgi:hypothetical protein